MYGVLVQNTMICRGREQLDSMSTCDVNVGGAHAVLKLACLLLCFTFSIIYRGETYRASALNSKSNKVIFILTRLQHNNSLHTCTLFLTIDRIL
jgi:hypothetical protein